MVRGSYPFSGAAAADHASQFPAVQTKNDHEAVQRSIHYMQEHYSEPVSVDQLAEIAGIGRARYTQLFKEITGRIPLEHLNGLRIERRSSSCF